MTITRTEMLEAQVGKIVVEHEVPCLTHWVRVYSTKGVGTLYIESTGDLCDLITACQEFLKEISVRKPE